MWWHLAGFRCRSNRFDIDKFKEAAAMLVGKHDFRTFMQYSHDTNAVNIVFPVFSNLFEFVCNYKNINCSNWHSKRRIIPGDTCCPFRWKMVDRPLHRVMQKCATSIFNFMMSILQLDLLYTVRWVMKLIEDSCNFTWLAYDVSLINFVLK